MIKANHTKAGALVCDFYSGFRLNRAFREIRYIGDGSDNGLPVLMIANHFSWWDGFIQYRLNKKIYGRKFHVMMLEEQLTKNMVLNKGGAFSIKKQSRDILKSLSYCSQLLTCDTNLVLLFPQGKIQSLYTPYIRFENGLSHLLQEHRNRFQVIFNVNLVDYHSERKPALTVYYKPYTFSPPDDKQLIEKAFNDFFTECKIRQCNPYEHR